MEWPMARARSFRVAAAASAVAAIVAVSSPAAAQAAGGASWQIAHHFDAGKSYAEFRSVAVAGSHAWAVGGDGVAGNGAPVAAYFSNGRWSASPVPGNAAHIGEIAAVSADGPQDAWAVAPGAVLHWDAGRWHIARRWNLSGGPPGPYKSGITAFGPANVWVFGGTSFGNGTWHLHGRSWTRVTGPGSRVFAASAVSPDDMWAIGGSGTRSILHYSRGSWQKVTSPSLAGLVFGSIFASSAASVWVTASPSGKTGLRLLHLHGTQWTSYPIPWTLPGDAVDPGGFPAGGLSPDGRGGFWLSAFSSARHSNWLLHFSPSGRWSRVRMTGSIVTAIVQVPHTTKLLAVGSTPHSGGPEPFTNAVIWGYGTTG
jgi:hypothetical protein